MATAELTDNVTCRGVAARLRSSWPRAYAATWLSTLACALLVAFIGEPARAFVRKVIDARMSPALNAHPTALHVLVLAAQNMPHAAWPLLLGGAGALQSARNRLITDALVWIALIANTASVGAALATYGARLLPYLPQVPLEWAALALGASAWVLQRDRALAPVQASALAGLILLILLGAAVLETYAVPR